ncbi:MAG: helix-turn-helix domain-containing protein [Clostridia bacterium]|nr:helix-turn-helix domain-containing protein [Clostridia bacterium]
MDELKETIANNLVQLRTHAKLTQLQLAEMLNYSDKAVSKWERGEAIPDLRVLIQLADIYHITVDDIISPPSARKKPVRPKMNTGKKRLLISLLSAGLVWFIATGIFMIFYFIPATAKNAWLTFVVAPFITAIPLTVFSVRWGNWITNIAACSLIIWTAAVIFHIFVITYTEFYKIYFIYIVAGVFQILIVLWFTLRKISKRKK